jgi:hypothetical protein
MTNDELNQVIEAIKLQRTFIARQAKAQFSLGDEVEFMGKRGYKSGTITKIARKYITVDCGFESWRVPASMLKMKIIG